MPIIEYDLAFTSEELKYLHRLVNNGLFGGKKEVRQSVQRKIGKAHRDAKHAEGPTIDGQAVNLTSGVPART